jgi:VCBS repeat-containing protein
MTVYEKSFRIILSLLFLLGNSRIPIVHAAPLKDSSASFNQELFSLDNCSFSSAEKDEATITMLPPTGLASCSVDVSSLATAIDLGGLELAFSADSYLGDDAPQVSITLNFGTGSPVTINRSSSSAGTEAMSSNASIPVGTRTITIDFNSTGTEVSNSTVFSNISLKINDSKAPDLQFVLSPESWTTGPVAVTVSASDEDSGVEGIYDSSDNKVGTASYKFSTTTNDSWTFYAKDNAGNISSTKTVTVNKIDIASPSNPTLSLASDENWQSSAIPFTITTETAGSGESPVIGQYRVDDGDWLNYSSGDQLNEEGSHTVSARAIDAAGNTSSIVTGTYKLDLTPPSIALDFAAHPQPTGGATISAEVTDANSGVKTIAYAAGDHDAGYFKAGSGTALIGSSFDVISGGVYSVYAEDNVGFYAVKTVTVNTYPEIAAIEDQSFNEDNTQIVSYSVGDLESAAADLTVEATASNKDIFPNLSVTNTSGSISLTLAPEANANGTSTITVSVSDPDGLTTTRTFSVVVRAVDDAPEAKNDSITDAMEDTPVTVDVLANDSDVDTGDSLTIKTVDDPANGTASAIDDGKKIYYVPDPNWSGVDTFSYTVKDSSGETAIAEVTITVNPVDDAPVISVIPDQTILEDSSTGALNFSVSDVDTDLSAVSVSVSSDSEDVLPEADITLTAGEGGQYSLNLTPAANANTSKNGTEEDAPVTITITAGEGANISKRTFLLSVTAVNDAPQISDLEISTKEDTAKVIDVLTSANDVENEKLTITDTSIPLHGTAKIDTEGTFITYTPNQDWNGPDSFTYKVTDAGGASTTKTISVSVEPVSDSPVAEDVEESINEDSSAMILLAGNATDPDILLNSDQIKITEVSGVKHGEITLAEDGQSFTYTPNANWNGIEILTYIVSDLANNSDSATATINVAAVNDDPIAKDDIVDATEDTPIPVFVLSNDTDVDLDNEGDNLTIVSVTQPANGTVDISTDYKSLTYTPLLNFNGEDIFTYLMTDGHGRQSEATVKMEVAAVNDAPAISTITDKTINEDTSTGALAFTVSDVDNLITDVHVSAESGDTAIIPSENITLTDVGDGQFTIALLPAENVNTTNNGTVANTPVKITISAADGKSITNMSFNITIDPVNDVPDVKNDTATTNEDNSKDIDVLGNDSDIEGETLKVSSVGIASHGTVEISTDHKFVTYTPAENYNGPDSFTYTAEDTEGGHNTGSVSVTVVSVNDAPIAGNDSITLNEDIVTTIDVLANDTDVDISSNPGLESLTIDSVGIPSHGTAAISNNKIVYTPASNYNGSDLFTYIVKDQSNAASTGTVNLTIKPVNDYPVFTNLEGTYSVNEDTSITINFNISDVETTTESLMLQVVSQNQTIVSDSKVVLSGLGDGDSATSLKITPNANQNGNVTFKLTLGDGFFTTTAYFTLTINPVNDDPVVNADRYTFTEDNSIVIDMDDLVNNDTDIDGDTLSFVNVVDKSLGTGTLTVLDAGQHTYTYTPPANFDESTTFRYTMTDGTVEKIGTVTLVAIPVNDPPILTLSSGNPTSFNEDTTVTINFTVSDFETAANKLAVQAGSSDSDKISPDGIAISCDISGSCSMVLSPEANKNGAVTISLSVSDGSILVQDDIPLTINPVEDPPDAIDDAVSVAMGGTVVIYPLSNDNDPDGDTISISSISTGSLLGSVVDNGNGTLTYKAPTGRTGTDSFTYTINDGNKNTDTATVTVTISGENNSPEITKVGNQFINEDSSTSAIAFSVSDPDVDDVLSLSKSSDTPSLISNDDIVITSTGTNTYTVKVTPLADQNGTANITLTVSDGTVSTSTTFMVVVYPVNDAPIAVADDLSINEDTALNFTSATLLANDTDVDEDTLQITKVTDPSHGRLTYTSSTGIYSYVPDGNYNGADSINYTITDGKVTAEAIVHITVLPVNDTPVAYSDWWTVSGSLGATRNADVRTNDYDIETSDSNLTVIIVTQPTYGTASVQANGTVTYTRDSTNFSADWKDSFTYRVQDDDASPKTSNVATVYIDDYWGPSIYGDDQWFETDEDTAKSMNLAIHDGYAQGYTVSFSTPTLGTITDTNSADNAITYTPKPNVYGSETVTYSLISNYTGNPTGSGKFYITIYPINDPPEITGSLPDMTTNEDTPSASVPVTISDVETAAKDLIFTASSSNSDVLLDSGISITRTNGDISFTMTPIANRYGSTTITLLASDGAAQTTRSFNLTVNPVNDAPVADDLSSTTNEDNPFKITVVSSASDIDGDSLTVSKTQDPLHGTLTINEDKTITYTPALNFNGTDNFTYELTDPSAASDTGVVTITVNPVNDPPEISNLVYSQTTLEDTPKAVTFNISDVDDTLSKSSVTISTDNTTLFPEGSITNNDTDGLITVTLSPAANLSGTAIQTVTVTDGKATATQTFRMTVTPVNDDPTAADDSFSTNEDTAKTFNVISNDSDIEPGTLTVVSFVKPAHGTVVNNRDGTLTYTPDANWNGTETFTYTIADVNNGQDSATITATVYPVNDAPVTGVDRATIVEDNSVTINVLANDYDIEGSALTLTDVADPAKGSAVNIGGGNINYTPDLNANGSDSFTYTVSDGELTSTGTVVITITAVNDAPAITTSDALPWQLYEDTPKTFPVKITDPETASDNLVVKITSSNQSLIPDTSITLTGSGENKYIQLSPLLNKFGELYLTIDVSDGVNTTTVNWTVDIISVNDLPTITNVADQTVNEDTATSALTFTVADIETAAADLSVTGSSSNTAVIPDSNIVIAKTGSGGRTVVVTPAANAVGSSTITLTVTDTDGGSATDTFKVTVNAVNDAPQAKDDSASVNEDSSVVVYALENDIDVDLDNEGDSLTIVSTSNVSSGSAAIATNGKSITYTPAANFNGTATFKYTMQDKNSVQSTALVTVSIAPVNDPPIAVADSATTSEDTSKLINVLSNDTDIDLSREGDTLIVSKVENFSNGTAVIAEDGKSVTFTPAADFYGTAGFDYTVSDKENASSSAHVTVSVTAVNDAPVISDIPDQTTAEDTSTGAISFTVSDVDNDAASLSVTAVAGNGTIVPQSSITLGGSGSSRTISILPAANLNTWNKATSLENPITITVTVSDGSLSRSDSFALSVTPVNDAPVAVNDSATTPEDTAKSISVLTNDSDVDIANEGDSILVLSAGNGTNGTVSVAADKKSVTYTPNLNFNGTDSFTYTITDLAGATATATVNMTVTAVNDAPTITAISNQTMDEDTTLGPISFTVDDVDNTASSLTVTAVSGNTTVFPNSSTYISLAGTTGSRTITLKPTLNQNTWNSGSSMYGTVTITMTVKDSGNLTAVKTFTVQVNKVNDAPIANNDMATVDEDSSVLINAISNDTDVDIAIEGDSISIKSVDSATHGVATLSGGKISFVPDADYYGTAQIGYTITDLAGATSSAVVNVTVSPVNDKPLISDVSDQTINEDSSTEAMSFTISDIDNPYAELTVAATSSNTTIIPNGNISLGGSNGSRTVIVTPAADKNTYSSGPITITLKVTDKDGLFSTDTFNVTVTPVNDSPAAVNDSKTLAEDDSATTIDVLGNDTDVDLNNEGDLLTIDSTSTPAHGTVTIASDKKTLTFKPDANWYGTTSFTYVAEDSTGALSNSATVSVTVTSVNDLPTAVDDTPDATLEDTPVTITVLDNDTDIDLTNGGDSLSIVSTSEVTHGSASISAADKTITFTPAANWNGTTSFIYTMKDNAGAQSQATVYITVTPVNDPPTAVSDSVSTDQDIPVKIYALSNDTDPDISLNLDKLTITGIKNVDNGTAEIAEDGSYITFTPKALWSGDETFDYTISDSKGETSSSTIKVTVNPENDPPTAVNDSANTKEDTLVNIDVLGNDTDPDLVTAGQTDDLTILSYGGSPQGTVTIASDNKSLSFKPSLNWNGTTSFTYTIQDKGAVTSTATVSVTVEAVNDDPVAVDDSSSTDEDTEKTISVLTNDTDVDLSREGDTLTIKSSVNGSHGSTEVSADKLSIVYTPEGNWNGDDSFSYIMQDSHGKTSSATVNIRTLPVNDPPTALDDNAEVDEDSSVVIDVLKNDQDVDLAREGDNLKIVAYTDASHGSVTIAEDGKTLTFTPDPDYNGPAGFSYTMQDKDEQTSSADVSVTVKPINDAPIAQDDSAYVDEDGTVTLDLLANDIDADLAQPEGDNLVILSTDGILHGTTQFTSGNKELIYKPDANWYGKETFTYKMKDKKDVTSSAAVTVVVKPVNDAPKISDLSDQTIDEDSSTGELNFSVSDIDNEASDLTVTAQTSNGTFIPNENIVLSGSGTDRTVKITPAADYNTYGFSPVEITLTVSDGSLIASDTFKVTIRPINDAPKAIDDTLSMNEDTAATINPLSNDTDVDLGKEGDSLTIISVSGLSNAKAVISSDKKSILFTPDGDWFGDNTFSYSISDSHGETSSAEITVSVKDMPEASLGGWKSDPSFFVKTPTGGEQYRDGQTIPVSWTAFDLAGTTYQLDFYDGASWQTLANGLASTSYNHQLKNTYLHTNSAHYRVLASGDQSDVYVAYSNYFTIDNRAPANVITALTTTAGNPYTPDTWTHLPVIVSARGGFDLTGILVKIYEGDVVLATGSDSAKTTISAPGVHKVSIVAVDPLGNQVILGTYTIKIDVLPPEKPSVEVNTSSASPAVGGDSPTSGGTIVFSFPSDPGSSGNSTLILPDGKTVPITEDYSWTTDQDGTYTFTVVDAAGNETTLLIVVTGGEIVSQTVADDSQPTATPTLEATIAAVFGGSADSALVAGWNWNTGAKTFGIPFGLLVLLIFLFFPNVKIIYYKRGKDGKVDQVTRWKFALPSKTKTLKVKVNEADNYEVVLSRALTRSLRGGSLTIESKGSKLGGSTSIPDNAKNKFKANF